MEIGLKHAVKPVVRQLAKPYNRWLVPVSVLLALVLWEGLVRLAGLPAYILPSPARVLDRFWLALADGSLVRNGSTTLIEVLLGLLAGVSLATLFGYMIGKSPLLERLLSPYLVASQAIPIVAIAPLLVIWLPLASSPKY